MPPHRKLSAVAAALAVILLFGAASAQAAIRYAAPGGMGTAPCADPQQPCTLHVAAGVEGGASPGDEVILAPGEYVDQKGDFGSFGELTLAPGIDLHGEAGGARPVLVFTGTEALAGVQVRAGDTVSDIRIENFSPDDALSVGGTVEGVIVRSGGGNPFTASCVVGDGQLRDSVCLTRGEGETALSEGGESHSSSTVTSAIRNVTAISTGAESYGMRFALNGASTGNGGFYAPTLEVDAKNVIAKGTKADVEAFAGREATVHVALENSDYQTASATIGEVEIGTVIYRGRAATVTPAGSGTNIEAEPRFASDGFHQLWGSPTIDRGTSDAAVGGQDIDGEARTISSAPDIGADEMTLPTFTEVDCAPEVTTIGGPPAACTATVANPRGFIEPPLGKVELQSSGHGSFAPPQCDLAPFNDTESSCKLSFIASRVGTDLIGGEYFGDAAHDPSESLLALTILPPVERKPPPNTRVLKLPRGKSPRGMTRFAFVSDQRGASFECKLDQKPFKLCASPLKVKAKPGPHTFSVRAVGSTGVRDPSPAIVHWRVGRR